MRFLPGVPIVLVAAGNCMAQQWTVIVLHPPGARWSECFAVNGTHQAGEVAVSEPWLHAQAGLWQGNPQSWTALTPSPESGVLRGMDATRQVGQFFGPCIWEGTPESRISLQPSVQGIGGVSAIRGNMQVGGFSNVTDGHAAMWRGTPESYVNLHPPGSIRSSARATDGILQGGSSDWQVGPTSVRQRATIWDGTASSFTLLGPNDHPSRIDGMAPGVQAGQVFFTGQGARAAIWRGTPETYVDMHPSGVTGSTLFLGTTGRVHVGRMHESGLARAAVNFDAPEAWLSLHQFLPPGYNSFSAANAVHQEGNRIFVCGYAIRDGADKHAILWIGTVPPEYCYANCDQSTPSPYLNIDDFTCFINQFASARALPYMEQLGHRANCDQSTIAPVLNVDDFTCFINTYAQGCD